MAPHLFVDLREGRRKKKEQENIGEGYAHLFALACPNVNTHDCLARVPSTGGVV
jgi:hypothetical protein